MTKRSEGARAVTLLYYLLSLALVWHWLRQVAFGNAHMFAERPPVRSVEVRLR